MPYATHSLYGSYGLGGIQEAREMYVDALRLFSQAQQTLDRRQNRSLLQAARSYASMAIQSWDTGLSQQEKVSLVRQWGGAFPQQVRALIDRIDYRLQTGGLGQAWGWQPRQGTNDRVYFDQAAAKGDCGAIRSITLDACRRAGSSSADCLQRAQDNERICMQAKTPAQTVSTTPPPPGSPPPMPGEPIRVSVRTSPIQIEMTPPQASYVPEQTYYFAPEPAAPVVPASPSVVREQVVVTMPANGMAAQYQPPTPEESPPRLALESQAAASASPGAGGAALIIALIAGLLLGGGG